MYAGQEMFSEIKDREAAREIFAKTINRVEMETHSYCNRRCSYCPNVVGDRLGANQRRRKRRRNLALRQIQEPR